MTTREQFQAELDLAFPKGATCQLDDEWAFHVPRVMVIDVDPVQLLLWPMDANGQQPLPVTVSMPEDVQPPSLVLDVKSEGASRLVITDAFPPALAEERLRWLDPENGWFADE